MAMAILATERGIPQLYYGSEIGMAGDKGKGDGDIRHDFPGGWKGDEHNAFTASGRNGQEKQYFDFTSKLFTWRKGKAVIHSGKTTQYLPYDNVYVYFRYNEKETVMVLVNNSKDAKTFGTGRFGESLKNYKSGTDVITGKTVNVTGEITMEPKSVMVLELK